MVKMAEEFLIPLNKTFENVEYIYNSLIVE